MGSLFGKKPPRVKPVPVAPDPDSETDQANQERKYSRQYGNRGRSGTVLSQGNTLG